MTIFPRPPWAVWAPVSGWPGGPTSGRARKITLHTTEGTGLPNWAVIGNVPHLTVNPATGQAWQHIDLARSAYALASPGPPQSPNMNAGATHVQVEIIGYAEDTPHYPHEWYDQLGRWLRWVCDTCGVPVGFPFPFTGQDGYGTDGAVRQSWDTYAPRSGILGHAHAPFNDHWDPGCLDTGRLLDAMGDDMPIDDDDARKIAQAVWAFDLTRGEDSQPARWWLTQTQRIVRTRLGTALEDNPGTTLLARVREDTKALVKGLL